jgi:hypothetical protein
MLEWQAAKQSIFDWVLFLQMIVGFRQIHQAKSAKGVLSFYQSAVASKTIMWEEK